MTLKCSKDAVKDGYIPERYAYQTQRKKIAVYDIYEEDRLISTMKVDINSVIIHRD